MTPEQLERVLDKLDSIDARLDTMSNVQVRQASSLDEHMRRTEILEKEMMPIKAHINLTAAVAKIITVMAALVGFVLTLKSLLG